MIQQGQYPCGRASGWTLRAGVGVAGGQRVGGEMQVRVRVCSQGLSFSNPMRRGDRGGEFPASEGSEHLFLILLSIYDFLPLPPPDSWSWLQPESPCGSKVLGKSPRSLQGFGAHFSLEKAKSRGGWQKLVKKGGLGYLQVLLLLCTSRE